APQLPDPSADLEARLRYIFDKVNEWLRFAEAKNATLVAAVLGASFGLARLAADAPASWWIFRWYVYFAVALLLLAAAAGLVSFVPQVQKIWTASRGKPRPSDNVLFFGDIARYSADRYLKALVDASGVKLDSPLSLHKNYADQVITNSRIALGKF